VIKNPLWIPYCAFVALGAINSGQLCINSGNPLWAVNALVLCYCFGYGYAKLRGLSLWP